MLATAAAAALPVVGVLLLARHGATLAAWVDAAPAWQPAVAVLGGGAVLCGLALLPTHALSLAGGYALGVWAGPAVAWAGVMLGAIVGYGAGRAVAGGGFAASLRRSRRWSPVADALLDASAARTAWLVALLRLSPLAPFAATNVALAALRVPIGPYLAGAAAGLAPRVVAVAVLGAGLAELDWSRPASPWLAAAGGVATVAAVVLAGRVAARATGRYREARGDAR